VLLFLVDAGADVNREDSIGWTPLHFACYNGQHSIAKILIEGGADIEASIKSGWPGWTPLHWACYGNYRSVAKLLIDSGANVSIANAKGETPLHHACELGHYAIAKLLVDRGADVNMTDYEGNTPFHLACKNSELKVIQLLFDRRNGAESCDKNWAYSDNRQPKTASRRKRKHK
jgi:ankyrin repeat protein